MYGILTKENKEQTFTSQLPTMQALMSGTIECYYPGSPGGDQSVNPSPVVHDTHTIWHNLGYMPEFKVYMEGKQMYPSNQNLFINKCGFYFVSYLTDEIGYTDQAVTISAATMDPNKLVIDVRDFSQGLILNPMPPFNYKIHYFIYNMPGGYVTDWSLDEYTIYYDKERK